MRGKKIIINKVNVIILKPFSDREKLVKRLEDFAGSGVDACSSYESLTSLNQMPISDSDSAFPADDSDTEVYDLEKEMANLKVSKSEQTSPAPINPITEAPALITPPEPIPATYTANVSDCALDKMNPIIWRKSNTPVVTGVNRVIINAKYDSPCIVFKDPFFEPFKPNELLRWCELEFHNDFIEPLRKFCTVPVESPETKILFRNKRVVLLTIGIIAVISVVVTTTVGIATAALVQTSESRVNISDVKTGRNAS